MKYEIWVRTKKLYVISFRFYVSKKSSNRTKRQGCCKKLERQCCQLTATWWKTPHKPTTCQPANWNTRQGTIMDWQPAKMPTENWVRNKRHRKQPTTERANWQTRTGDNVKLLLHNLFFISSFSGGCEKKYLERNKSRRVKKKITKDSLPVNFLFHYAEQDIFCPQPKLFLL